MKQVILFLFALLLINGRSFCQQPVDIFSLRMGYGSTNIVFKEAIEPSIQFFGYVFNTGKTFSGSGPQFGVSKNIHKNMFIDMYFTTFSGSETKTKINSNEHYYTIKGYQVPLTVNYLLRHSTKRLRINAGAGFQYLTAHLKQFENISFSSGAIINQLSGIDISEFQFVVRPGIQFRIISTLSASFIITVSISTTGRYADNPCFSLSYTFTRKKSVPG